MTYQPIWTYRLLQHLAFWLCSFAVLIRVFALDEMPVATDWIYTFLFHFFLWTVVYLNLELSIPRLLSRGRHVLYGLSLVGLLALGTGIYFFTFQILADWLFPGYYFIAYYTVWDILQFTVAYLVITSLLKLSRAWFQRQQQEKALAKMNEERKAAELQALKGQLEPHFLFNSLNTLYAMALEGDYRTADYIQKLSDNLRRLLELNRLRRIPLREEIKWIDNYLALQSIRLDRNIQLEEQGDISGVEVPPLLFLPILENIFAHGHFREKGPEIFLGLEGSMLVLRTKNPESEPAQKSEHTGLGLEGLRRRLELEYPDKHELYAGQTGQTYLAELKIDTA